MHKPQQMYITVQQITNNSDKTTTKKEARKLQNNNPITAQFIQAAMHAGNLQSLNISTIYIYIF